MSPEMFAKTLLSREPCFYSHDCSPGVPRAFSKHYDKKPTPANVKAVH